MRRIIQAEQDRCMANLGSSLQQDSTSMMNTMSEATTSPVQKEISSNTLIITDIPNVLTYTNTTNDNEESLHLNDSLSTATVNDIDSTIVNDYIGICDKLRTWNVEFNVSHNCLNKLLTILKSEGLDVPKDGRT